MTPITLSSTFKQPSPGVLGPGGYDYSRSGNPTREAYESCICALENGKHGLAFASGLACTTTIMHLLSAGDHVISIDDVYGGTSRYFRKCGEQFGLTFSFVDLAAPGKLAAAITPKTKMLWIETPTNPTLKLTDIAAVMQIVRGRGITVVVDNTFLSPFFQKPLDMGACISMNSVSKYINGHSDVIGGCLSTNDTALYERLKFYQNSIGTVPSPFDCYMVMRGAKTLHVRMPRHQSNAMAIAKYLEAHPKVEKVLYPGLPSHPQHALAVRTLEGFGGMITFYVHGGLAEARSFLEATGPIMALAESLGGVETLIEHPAIMTHASVEPEVRKQLGISDTLIRLSVGIEDLGDILKELEGCLDAIGAPKHRL